MLGTNAVAYYAIESVTKKKRFFLIYDQVVIEDANGGILSVGLTSGFFKKSTAEKIVVIGEEHSEVLPTGERVKVS